MKAGLLDREITLQRNTPSVNAAGTVTDACTSYATLRAQRIQTSTTEFMRAFGDSTETVMVFRTRYVTGVQVSDQVVFEGTTFELVQVVEIGRRVGLELRCQRIGQ